MEHCERFVESEKSSDSPLSKQPQSELKGHSTWAQLIAEYLNDLPRQLDGIRGMLEEKDYAAIKHHAHRAKGTSGTYRLRSISKHFAQLEILAESQNPEAIFAAVNEIMRLVEAEIKRLNPRIASPTDSSERNING